MSEITDLLEIQRLENEEAQLAKQLKRIPEYQELRLLKSEIEGLQETTGQLKDQLLNEQKKLKKKEAEIESLKEKLDEASSELYSGGITNVKELEAAEKKTVMLKEAVRSAEDKLLELMSAVEERQAGIKKLTTKIAKMKTSFLTLNEEYKSKRDELTNHLEKIQQEQAQIWSQISKETQAVYQTLREKYSDRKAVAVLRKGACSGCNMSVSFELLKMAKHQTEGLKCDNCGRLLIIE